MFFRQFRQNLDQVVHWGLQLSERTSADVMLVEDASARVHFVLVIPWIVTLGSEISAWRDETWEKHFRGKVGQGHAQGKDQPCSPSSAGSFALSLLCNQWIPQKQHTFKSHCDRCTHCKRQSTLVHPMQRVNNHLLVAVLMDDARKGIEYQMDPSSFSSISLLTSQPFVFSLFITANMMAMFCSHLHNLSEYCFALFRRNTHPVAEWLATGRWILF